MKEEYLIISTYMNSVEAHMDLNILISEGIDCYLENENMGVIYPGVIGIELKVIKKDADRAKQILGY